MTYNVKLTFSFLLIVASGLLISACSETENPTPKPHAWPRIEYPKRAALQEFDHHFCNFSFQYANYIAFEQDSTFFDEKAKDPCWFNLTWPMFNAKLHCSYYPISAANRFDELVADAFDLAGKHNVKADFIDELPIRMPNGVSGMVFDIQGPAASPFQFYLTDSTNHFIRGALYFNTKTSPDSLAPVYNFVKTDITQLINSFNWNKK